MYRSLILLRRRVSDAKVTYKALLEAFAEDRSAERAVWVLDEMEDMQVPIAHALPCCVAGFGPRVPRCRHFVPTFVILIDVLNILAYFFGGNQFWVSASEKGGVFSLLIASQGRVTHTHTGV